MEPLFIVVSCSGQIPAPVFVSYPRVHIVMFDPGILKLFIETVTLANPDPEAIAI